MNERKPDVDFLFVQVTTEPPLTGREKLSIESAILAGWVVIVSTVALYVIKLFGSL